MKMMIKFFSMLLVLCAQVAFAADKDLEIIKTGFLDKDTLIESKVINDKDDLSNLWKQIGEKSKAPSVDFSKESVVFIITKKAGAGKIDVNNIEIKAANKINVFYAVSEKDSKSPGSKISSAGYPYIVGKLANSHKPKYEISLRENFKVPPIPANQALGQDLKYDNTLSQYDLEIVKYVPLDLGNSWTYKIESNKNNTEITHEIQSVSDGWSVLSSYFGRQNVAMKIEHSGELVVSSDKGVRAFYTRDVQTTFIKDEIKTPAGSFKDLMIVTIPQNNNFWFRDVYAKGVGLVFHEHISPKGSGKYTLLKAKVRGKDYPG